MYDTLRSCWVSTGRDRGPPQAPSTKKKESQKMTWIAQLCLTHEPPAPPWKHTDSAQRLHSCDITYRCHPRMLDYEVPLSWLSINTSFLDVLFSLFPLSGKVRSKCIRGGCICRGNRKPTLSFPCQNMSYVPHHLQLWLPASDPRLLSSSHSNNLAHSSEISAGSDLL